MGMITKGKMDMREIQINKKGLAVVKSQQEKMVHNIESGIDVLYG